MFIIRRQVIGKVEPGVGGRDWRAATLQQIALHLDGEKAPRRHSGRPEPLYFEATWDDGTKMDLSFEPPEPDLDPEPEANLDIDIEP